MKAEGNRVIGLLKVGTRTLFVNHNGTINVDADEVINQIMPDLKSFVRDQIMRSANGNPAPPSPTKNTGTGTQKGFKGTPYGL